MQLQLAELTRVLGLAAQAGVTLADVRQFVLRVQCLEHGGAFLVVWVW